MGERANSLGVVHVRPHPHEAISEHGDPVRAAAVTALHPEPAILDEPLQAVPQAIRGLPGQQDRPWLLRQRLT
ncbi:MAG: hypothetical protein WAW78_13150, partial [Propioniciclava sp.]